MKCMKCGQEIMDGALFCPYCGEKIIGEKIAAERPGEESPKEEKPIYTAEVKNMLKSGRMDVYRDRVEFLTGNAQKTVFDFSALMAVKKGLDRINFITEDGRTVSCPVSRKNIHEAFVYVEQAFRPYIGEREQLLLSKGIRYSFVSSQGLNGGVLDIMEDRVEFRPKSGEKETVWYRDVKAVSLTIAALQFLLIDGTSKAFSVDRELRDEVFSYVEKATGPYIEERKENLLAKGIYYSFPITPGPGGGTVDIMEDRVEFKFGTGQRESVFYQDILEARLSMGMWTLELFLTNGTSRTFSVDKDVRNEVLAFIQNAVKPYAAQRAGKFGMSFGMDERIEIDEASQAFHIVRQRGRMVTREYLLSDLVTCEGTEYGEEGSVLGSVLSAVGIAGAKETQEAGKRISQVGVLLTIRADQGTWTEGVRFGIFSPGISRMNKNYEGYAAEVSRFMDYLEEKCPACERILPKTLEHVSNQPAIPERSEPLPVLPEPKSGSAVAAAAVSNAPAVPEAAAEKDRLGIKKYIEGVSRFISACETPMMIAIQGNWNNNIMKMLSDELRQYYRENVIWYNTLQFTQSDFGEGFPLLVGNRLIRQLDGSEERGNERAVKAAKGIINIVSGVITQGGTDGKNLTDALFKDNSSASVERIARTFSGMIMGRTGGGNGKVIILVDDLDRLTPAQAVELLESMKNFYSCRGCVFVTAADYDFIIRGAKERYHQEFDENKGKSFFDKMFQVSFRVPVSGYNISKYVKEKLEEMEIDVDDETELETYGELVRCSLGNEPAGMKRLFNSFLLLKKLADEETFENKNRRQMLFALLCMQTKFREIYDFIVQRKEQASAAFLSGLCSNESETWDQAGVSDREVTEFLPFAKVFYHIVDAEKGAAGEEGSEFTRTFAEILEFSSITSK